jgi:hypothetical protein
MASHNQPDAILEKVLVREVAGVFRSKEALEATIDELRLAGFDRADIDLMADVEAIRRKLGTVFVPPEELADIPGAPRTAFVARDDAAVTTIGAVGTLFYVGAAAAALGVVASGGPLALAIAAAAAGGGVGGGIGALAAKLLGREQAKQLETQMLEGGLVLWVRVRDPEHEARAQEILRKHGAEAVRVHEIPIEKRLDDLPLASIRPDPWLGDERLGQV